MKKICLKALAEIIKVIAAAILAAVGVSTSGCILTPIF